MAATAYAAAVSLLNTMDQIQIHPFLSTYFNINYSIESQIREKVDFFVDFVEKYSDAESKEAEDLLRRIADVAHEAEEIINVEAEHRIRDESTKKSRRMTRKLKKITQEMDGIQANAMNAKEDNSSYAEDLVRRMAAVALKALPHKLQREKKAMKAEEKTRFRNQQLTSSEPSSSSAAAPPATVKTTTMVGFDGYLEKLLDELTGHHSGRKILPIVGMGGIVAVDFLDEKNSWELFCEKTFAQQGCPHPELEQVGKKIVKKCKGLPLAITVIGGLLGKSSKSQGYWEKIAEDKSLILDSGEGNTDPLSIIYLSYKHLPVWLKSCFLYLGLFPEDHQIEVSQLIKLWVAEGFIKAKSGQSLEDVAESYIRELLVRNLLIVGELRINKNLKSCRVHDIVRELCIRIGEKEKYFSVQRYIDGMSHFIVDEVTARLFYPKKDLPSIIRPLRLKRRRTAPFKSRLLRVLLVDDTDLDCWYQQVNLRFLFTKHGFVPSIHQFWSLQTLIVPSPFHGSIDIWEIPQLRHMEVKFFFLPDPPSPTREDDVIVLQYLQTLKRVRNLVLSEEVSKRIPNIKELDIHYDFDEPGLENSGYHLQNLGCFNKLESLELYDSSERWRFPGVYALQKLKLPSSLEELSLCCWKLARSDMEMTASLPHLQFLMLRNNAVVGAKWDCVEGEFLSLKHLQIDGCDDLINWSTADSSSFPVLETLSLINLHNVEEIPSGIGDIPTLERMDVRECSESIIMSAMRILEEQESLGNQSLQLTLKFFFEADTERWRGKIEEMGIELQNLQLIARAE